MSAIFGIFRIDGQDIDPKMIKDMDTVLSHRGPDGSGVWLDRSIALGHQMLHTTPESVREKLPFKDETTGMVITADARIDNRSELSNLLNLGDTEEVPDSLFILKAYQKWGENCPDRLLGDFAFAIWDPVNECLFCARDHMGVKSFYYYLSDEVFYFATEIKAILKMQDVPRRVNELKIAFYLKFMILDKELTFYEDIFGLPGANFLKIDHQRYEIKKYWDIDPEFMIKLDSEEEYVTAFREIFEEAVKCRLRSAVPVGFLLSGGLDSTSVVCMAKKILEKDSNFNFIETFSYVSDDVPGSNERNFIEETIETGGIHPTFIHADKISPFEEIETLLENQEQPFFTPHMSIFRNMYRAMHEENIRISLDGEGGDQISSIGPNYFKELFVTLQWKILIREIKYLSKQNNRNPLRIFINYAFFPCLPRKLQEFYLNYRKISFENDDPRFKILNKSFSQKLGGENHLEKVIRGPTRAANTPRKLHHLYLTGMAIESDNETRDKSGGEFFIESRSPFRDKRLIEFCYGVPTEIKYRYGWDRYLHRAAMKGIIPEGIRCKPFKHPGPPISQRNILFFGKNTLDEIINTDNKILADYINLDLITDIYQKYKSGNAGTDTIFLWFSVILYFWLRKMA